MSVMLQLPLFDRPGSMLSEGDPVTPKELNHLGRFLRHHLRHTSKILKTLHEHGWTNEVSLYSIAVTPKKECRNAEEAAKELKRLGIDPDAVDILEDEGDDEDDLDEDDHE